jgi:hypothetical protein
VYICGQEDSTLLTNFLACHEEIKAKRRRKDEQAFPKNLMDTKIYVKRERHVLALLLSPGSRGNRSLWENSLNIILMSIPKNLNPIADMWAF